MALSKDRLHALKNEIIMAEVLNREELEPILAANLRRYIGEFIPPIGGGWDIVLNEVYPIIQNNLPSIFFRNPRAFLKPRNKTFIAKRRDPRSGKMVEVQLDSTASARTQEHILNYTISQIKYKKEVRKVLLDALLFPHGVLWHGYKGEFGMTEEQSIDIKNDNVFVRRISPMRFIKDPSVSMANLDEAKWVGRIIDMPLIDIIEDDKLDVDKELIKGFKGFGDKVGRASVEAIKATLPSREISPQDFVKINQARKNLIEWTEAEFKSSKFAHFIRVYEIFLRPTKKEKRNKEKGKILLLTNEQVKPLRENEWRIKAEGYPAKILEFNGLNDNLFGLSDVETYASVADQKNAIINLQLRNAQENSKVWVGISKEQADEHDVEHIQKGEQSIVLFESGNPRDRMFVASPGGTASSELYLIDQRIQKNLEDKSGVTDLKRGFLQSGEESAASVKLRAAGGGARPAYRQDLMSDFLKESLLYTNQLLKQFVPVKEAVRIVGSLDIEWSDNPSKEELQADIDVEIDVISMLPENPEKELRELNTVLVMMIQALQSPAVMRKIQEEGKTLNLSPIIEQMFLRMKVRNPDIFRNIKPEESQGFVSVQQVREAKQNANAAIKGQQIPFPPKMDDDHLAKIEVYTAISQLLKEAGQVSQALEQLIQIHAALIQELQKKQATPGQAVSLKKPTIETV
jgi:hypothetical protein